MYSNVLVIVPENTHRLRKTWNGQVDNIQHQDPLLFFFEQRCYYHLYAYIVSENENSRIAHTQNEMDLNEP